MVLHNPNNWHWVNKNVIDWGREYLEKTLVGVRASEGDVSAQISKVTITEGFIEVNQRKGKVSTLFDIVLSLEFEGKTAEDSEATGKINIPEVAYNTEEDEYVFDVSIIDETASKAPLKPLIKTKMLPEIRAKLATLGSALVQEHGKDIQHGSGTEPSSQPAKTTSSNLSSEAKSSTTQSTAKTVTSTTAGQRSVNTTSITASDEFRTTASELYNTFTDPARIAAFTRAPPRLFEGAHPGGKFSLFGGNISGEFEELKEPTLVVQKWRLGTWAQGHFSRLEIKFDQNEVDHVTIMRVEWSGVPIGEEEVVRRNWGEYYVRSIKTTFGFGTIL